VSFLEAGVRLAHSWGGAKKDDQPAPFRLDHDPILPFAASARRAGRWSIACQRGSKDLPVRRPPIFRQPTLRRRRPLEPQTDHQEDRESSSALWSGGPATFSRWQYGFESRWGYCVSPIQGIRDIRDTNHTGKERSSQNDLPTFKPRRTLTSWSGM
jgi:hypothetical protein